MSDATERARSWINHEDTDLRDIRDFAEFALDYIEVLEECMFSVLYHDTVTRWETAKRKFADDLRLARADLRLREKDRGM